MVVERTGLSAACEEEVSGLLVAGGTAAITYPGAAFSGDFLCVSAAATTPV
jgi:hypothetical protein